MRTITQRKSLTFFFAWAKVTRLVHFLPLLVPLAISLMPLHVSAQGHEEVVNYSPDGVFDVVYDSRGNASRLSEIIIDQALLKSNSASVVCSTSGYFVLHFDVGSGMENSTDPVHQARRAVFCQLFSDLSQFIIPANSQNQVHIWIRNFNDLNLPIGITATASSYYTIPENIPASSAVVDGVLWQTINSGHDAYENVISPLSFLGVSDGNNGGMFYHAYMAFDFGLNWHTDLSSFAGAAEYDLYTVALREITHALGFQSLIADNGNSIFGSAKPFYSRYDTKLKTQGGVSLLQQTGQCAMYGIGWNPQLIATDVVSPNSGTPCLTNGTVCSTAVKYVGSTTQFVYTPNCYEQGFSLSCFEETCLSPPNNGNDQYFVTSNSIGYGQAFTKRFLKEEEKKVLCDIGYSVAPSYGITSNIHHTFHSYSDGGCNVNLHIAGVNDGIDLNGAYTFVATTGSILFSGSAILSNDYQSSGFQCLQPLIGGGSVSVSSGGLSTLIVFTPPANSTGLFLLRYIPVNGSRKGNVTYVYVYVNPLPCTASLCNLIPDGGFEGTSGVHCKQGINSSTFDCWRPYTGTPDLFGVGCTSSEWPGQFNQFNPDNPPMGGTIPTTNTLWWDPAVGTHPGSDATNQHFIGLLGWTYSGGFETPGWEESVQMTLSNALLPNETYRIQYWAYAADNHDCSITISATSGPLAEMAGNYVPSLFNVLGGPQMIPDDNQWHLVSFVFTTPNVSGLNNLLIGFDNSVFNSNVATHRCVFIDDVSMTKEANVGLTINPDHICLGQTIPNLSLYANPPGGSFEGDGVALSAGAYTFSADVAGLGQHDIVYSFTDNVGCDAFTSDIIFVTNYTSLMITATPDAITCTGQPVTLTVTNPLNSGVVTWTPSAVGTLTGSSITVSPTASTIYQAQSAANGCNATGSLNIEVHSIPIITSVLPQNPCFNQCNGSITVSYSYQGPASDISFIWIRNGNIQVTQTGAVFQNACPGVYSVYATTPYGCTSQGQTVTLIATPVPSLQVSTGSDVCAVGCNGTISVSSASPFSIAWNSMSAPNNTSANPTGLCPGTYTASITFQNGCLSTATAIIAPSFNAYSNITGTVNITNNSNLVIDGIIEIQSGGVLNIMGSTLRFTPTSRIIVHNGGNLKVEESTLTHACPSNYWVGLVVEGTPSQPQSNVATRGKAIISKGSVIEYALVGARSCGLVANATWPNYSVDINKSGGFIWAANSTFRNNKIDVSIPKYLFENSSSFYDIKFQLDENYLTFMAPGPRVSLVQCRKVPFKGCKWSNTFETLLTTQGANFNGIYSYKASFIINEAGSSNNPGWYPSQMEGFYYGINYVDAGLDYFSVANTDFRCFRGIYAKNAPTSSEISYCNFYGLNEAPNISMAIPSVVNDGNPDPFINAPGLNSGEGRASYGIYMMSGGNYRIHHNYFQIVVPNANAYGHTNSNILRVGLFVNSSDTDPVVIWKNQFYDMTGGARFYNDNRQSDGFVEGLSIQCNEFRGNYRDVEMNSTIPVGNAIFGIRKFEYAPGYKSLGNSFSDLAPNNPNFDYDDIKNFTNGQHTVRYMLGELTLAEVFGINPLISAYKVDCDASPYSNAQVFPVASGTILSELEILKTLYSALVDNGNTEGLKSEVVLSQYSEALQLYNKLMSASPALSTEVMLEAIKKETELPSVLLTSVLAANPSAAKSEAVDKELEARTNPLTDYQIELIKQGYNTLSLKENLEQQIQEKLSEYYFSLAEWQQTVLLDSTDTLSSLMFPSIMYNLPDDNASQRIKLRWLIEQGDFTAAQQVCQALIERSNPKLSEFEDLTKVMELLPTMKRFFEAEPGSMDQATSEVLQSYLSFQWPDAFGYALGMLEGFGGFEYEEPTDYPEVEVGQRSLKASGSVATPPSWISIYPNPTSGLVYVRLNKAPITVGARLQITDLSGRVVAGAALSNRTFEYVIDLSNLAKGIYSASIIDEKQAIHHQTLIIE